MRAIGVEPLILSGRLARLHRPVSFSLPHPLPQNNDDFEDRRMRTLLWAVSTYYVSQIGGFQISRVVLRRFEAVFSLNLKTRPGFVSNRQHLLAPPLSLYPSPFAILLAFYKMMMRML